MFGDTLEFTKLIDGCFCICFTATPDNCDAKGAQSLIADTLQFSRHSYVLDDPTRVTAQLEVDAVIDAKSAE